MTSEIKLQGQFNLSKLSTLLTAKLAGHAITERILIEAVELKGDEDWMYAEMRVAGRWNGTLVAQFKLYASDESPDFFVRDLHVKIADGGLIADGANFFLKHLLGKKIEKSVQEKIQEALRDLIEELNQKFALVELGDGVVVRATLTDYNFVDITWDEHYFKCKLSTHGVISVELN